MRKILVVIGTRPEAIKMAPVITELRQRQCFSVAVCATGQHPDMLAHGLDAFDLKPDFELEVPQGNPGLHVLTAHLLTSLSACMASRRPDAVLVHGDTQSCFAAALAAFWYKLRVGHVEAGLRTKRRDDPFPEEMNRRLTDQVAEWHFAPTTCAYDNLVREGVSDTRVFVTGNTAIDALMIARSHLKDNVPGYVSFDPSTVEGKQMVLVTGHRRENHGPHMESLCAALLDVVRTNREVHVVYPVHMNPDVQAVVRAKLGDVERVSLIPPQPYLAFVDLMCRSTVIVTDSGGIQEEAPSLGKPVLVTRTGTERPEMLSTGLVKVIGNDTLDIRDGIIASLRSLPNDELLQNPCGDGRAAVRIGDILQERV